MRTCRQCGCSDHNACLGRCWWVTRDLCSACSGDGVADYFALCVGDQSIEVPADLYFGLALHQALDKPGLYVVTHTLTGDPVVQGLASLSAGRTALGRLAEAWSGWERFGTAQGVANAIPRNVLDMIQTFGRQLATQSA